jgi:phospholipid/cholesterol/gamma-HCH transport system substrate-binding protein
MDSTKFTRRVGLFVLGTLVLVGLLILNFSKGTTFFTPHYTIVVKADTVGGMKVGANVLMAGVPIGSVERIELERGGKAVLIYCRINKRYEIFDDASFEIEQSGFLGDQYVAINPKDNKGRPLGEGSVVRARNPFNITDAARSAMGLMSKLDSAATKIETAVTRVDKLLLSEDTLTNLAATLGNLRHLSDQAGNTLQELENLVKANRPGIGVTVSNLSVFTSGLSGLSDKLASLSTNLDSLLVTNKTEITEAVRNLRSSTERLKLITADLQSGKGLAGALLKDDELNAQFKDLVANLATVSSNLSRFGLLYKPKQTRVRTNASIGRDPFR